MHQNSKYYKVRVTAIKLDILSTLEEKDRRVPQHTRCYVYQVYSFLFVSILFYSLFTSTIITVRDLSTLHILPILNILL